MTNKNNNNKINQAIILAAGSGTRLRPLTHAHPKPMLTVNNKPLLVYQLEALASAGIKQVVIHVAYLADNIINTIKDGSQYGLNLNIKYARLEEPLETGGGLNFSIPMLAHQDRPFICLNGKVFTDYNYSFLNNIDLKNNLAHFVLVPNPKENPEGDFNLSENNYLIKKAINFHHDYTFSGIAVYNTVFLKEELALLSAVNKKFSVIEIIKANLDSVSASIYRGEWHGLETLEQYNNIKNKLDCLAVGGDGDRDD